MRRFFLCSVAALGLCGAVGCQDGRDGDAGSNGAEDAWSQDAAIENGSDADDAASEDTRAPGDSGRDADRDTDRDAGRDTGRDADAAQDPDDGCDPGYSPDGTGGCAADPVSDPATRTRQEVCGRWRGYTRQMTQLWQQEPSDQCDWGVLHAQAHGDALRRLSVFRWLVGLDPVVSDPGYVEVAQACATTLAAEGAGLTHHIPSDFACYTQEAASGASSSNIALGVGEPASTVDLYVGDHGVPSLGHRRWCLNPSMGATGFGQRGSYSCMYSFDRSRQSSVEHVLYPSAGYFPRDALLGVWSAASRTFSFGASPEVSVTRVSDATNLQVDAVSMLPHGYGLDTISWQVPDAQPGVAYQVSVSNGSQTLSYETTLVDCP